MREETRIRAEDLRKFLEEAFRAIGLSAELRRPVVDQMVLSSLRGVDTHGVLLTERYIEGVKEGRIRIKPKITTIRQNRSTVLIDGGLGPGQYVARRATEIAMRRASACGMGAVGAINLGHVGALSHYGLLIAKRRMAGMVFTNSASLAAPWGGATRVFGTNPMCVSFPYRDRPIVLDIATTVAAGQKIVLAKANNKPIPIGWALDKEGKPTTDPSKALAGSLLPFGEYKGYGLMFMVELYSAVMLGGRGSYDLRSLDRYEQGGFYVQALNISSMRDYRDHLRDLDRLVEQIRSSKLVEGVGRIYLPGELELITTERRRKDGIPVDKQTWDYFVELSREHGLRLPKPIATPLLHRPQPL